MATRMTQTALARLSRRTGGLDRLAGQYRQQVADLTDQYSTSFRDYQQRVSATMAPYEEAMQRFTATAQPQYEQAVSDYNAKLDAYRAQLAELEKNPVIERQGEVSYRTWYGKKKTDTFTYYEPKEIPTFAEKAPEIPDMPVAPQVEQFDNSQFEGKRQMASSTLQREIGERRSARLQATRRTARTMLGGTKA